MKKVKKEDFNDLLKHSEKTAKKLWDNKEDEVWNKILYGERVLSDEDAEEMLEMSKKLRKEWGFRKIEDF